MGRKHERGVIFTRDKCIVKRNFVKKDRLAGNGKWQPKGTVYYTVVNKSNNTHRHYTLFKQAKIICKKVAKKEVPYHYNKLAVRDIVYLLTGDKRIYYKKMSKDEIFNDNKFNHMFNINFKGGKQNELR